MIDPTASAREYVLDTHAETVETVLQCADAVADQWASPTTTDREEVAVPLRAELEARGAWERLPEVLAGAVRETEYSLSASPVADPPYVTVTSRGPILRATLPPGRLVVRIEVFDIERGAEGRPQYVRGAETVEDAVRVTLE